MNYASLIRNLEAKLARQRATVVESEEHLATLQKLQREEIAASQPNLPLEKKK